ncbi:MAG: T9SS type A sorting domain-containing protein [Crocinitomix sp.]|nr:T9SS type A sorting domain-containing protein [Crocinitomix sp.]
MNKLFTLLLSLTLGFAGFGQVIFESDLSSWTDGDPDGWMGSKTNIGSENVVEQEFGAMHGTAMAQLFNEGDAGSHKRFTTEEMSVTELETYEVTLWLTGIEGSMLRTGYYNPAADSWFYNDYIDVYAETGGDIGMVSQTLTMPSECTAAEFILSAHSTDALVGIVVDSVSIAVGEPEPSETVSIYDIQYSEEADFISPYADELVTTSGIVTGVFLFGAAEGTFFIQDGDGAWNGIYVFESATVVELGDSVVVTGEVAEYFTLTEIVSVITVNVISSGHPMPNAIAVPTGSVTDEEYEGVLVLLEDAKCTNPDVGFGQFEVDDNSGARLVDDEMYTYTPALNSYYNITGVSFLSFGETKVYPRMLSDIEVTGYAGIYENSSELNIYPNPANEFIKLNVSSNAGIVIYSIDGAMVYSENGNVNTIDVSAFDAGVYQVVVTENETTMTERLIVR